MFFFPSRKISSRSSMAGFRASRGQTLKRAACIGLWVWIAQLSLGLMLTLLILLWMWSLLLWITDAWTKGSDNSSYRCPLSHSCWGFLETWAIAFKVIVPLKGDDRGVSLLSNEKYNTRQFSRHILMCSVPLTECLIQTGVDIRYQRGYGTHTFSDY